MRAGFWQWRRFSVGRPQRTAGCGGSGRRHVLCCARGCWVCKPTAEDSFWLRAGPWNLTTVRATSPAKCGPGSTPRTWRMRLQLRDGGATTAVAGTSRGQIFAPAADKAGMGGIPRMLPSRPPRLGRAAGTQSQHLRGGGSHRHGPGARGRTVDAAKEKGLDQRVPSPARAKGSRPSRPPTRCRRFPLYQFRRHWHSQRCPSRRRLQQSAIPAETQQLLDTLQAEATQSDAKALHRAVTTQASARKELDKLRANRALYLEQCSAYIDSVVNLFGTQMEEQLKILEPWSSKASPTKRRCERRDASSRSSTTSYGCILHRFSSRPRHRLQQRAGKGRGPPGASRSRWSTRRRWGRRGNQAEGQGGQRHQGWWHRVFATATAFAPCLGPQSGRFGGCGPIQPPSLCGHSVMTEDNFVSPWSAELLGVALHFEVEMDKLGVSGHTSEEDIPWNPWRDAGCTTAFSEAGFIMTLDGRPSQRDLSGGNCLGVERLRQDEHCAGPASFVHMLGVGRGQPGGSVQSSLHTHKHLLPMRVLFRHDTHRQWNPWCRELHHSCRRQPPPAHPLSGPATPSFVPPCRSVCTLLVAPQPTTSPPIATTEVLLG